LLSVSTLKSPKKHTYFKISLNQVKKDGGLLGDIPLIVITGGEKGTPQETGQNQKFLNQQAAIWNQLQKDLVTKSTNGKQIFAEHSGHGVPRLQPEIIVQAVQELVTEIRENTHEK
jgi:hypothetical protein